MATVNKNFRVKNGLVVEGTTGTIDGNDILTTASDTGDLSEGTNLYFTDARAKTSAADLLTNATLSNITITGDGNGIVITAENGVDDSTTDDLDEGSNNLYFTNARAVSAIEGEASLTLTGTLTLSADPSANLEAATKQYVDAAESAAETSSNTYTDDLIGDATVDGTGGNTVTDRISAAVSNLVDSAPGTLDTLNELAEALGDDPDFATTITNSIGEKVAKAGSTMTGFLTLHADPNNNLHAATKQYVDNSAPSAGFGIDVTGTTVSAISADIVGAEDTDTLSEGSTNLYFTDARAVSALEAVVPNFTEVEINSVASQVAATINLANTTQTSAYSFDGATYRSAKFIVKAGYGTHTEVSEVLITLDTSDNIAITEYAVVSTNGNLIDITAGMSGTDVELLVTAITANTDVTVVGTLIQ